jgi:hypothetical protein
MRFQNKELGKKSEKELKNRRNPFPFLKSNLLFFWICHLIFYSSSFASSNPQSFTFEGVLLDSDGATPLNGDVILTLDIYDPSGSCLLYEQQVGPLDLTAGKGVFSVGVGTTIGDSTRTPNDPGLSMDAVFANTSSTIRAGGSANCTSGYLPNAGDTRSLQVTISPSGGSSFSPFSMSPAIVIDNAPYATVAETLQGIAPTGFLQPNPSQNLSQITLAQLTAGGDASTLHNHDSLYAKLVGGSLSLGTNTYFNLGGHASNPALVPSDVGKIWFDSTNDVIKYYDGTTIQTLSTSNNTSYSTLGVGGTLNPNTQLESTITNPSNVGLLIQGASGQTANLWNVTNSSGSSLSSINPSGTLSAVAFSGNGSQLSSLNASNLTSGSVPLSVLPQASSTTSGYLSSTDWNTFNS